MAQKLNITVKNKGNNDLSQAQLRFLNQIKCHVLLNGTKLGLS